MARIIDFIFIYILSFALGFTWTRYYIDNVWICFFLAIILAVSVGTILEMLFSKNRKRKKEKLMKKDEIRNFVLSLAYNRDSILNFGKAFKNQGYSVTYYKNAFTAEKENKKYLIYPHFTLKMMDAAEIADFMKLAGGLNIYNLCIFTDKADSQLNSFIPTKYNYHIYDENESYKLLKNNQALPDMEKSEKMHKDLPKLVRSAFLKSRSSMYFISSLFLLITSFIAFYPLLYIIFATINFILALYSRFNKRFNIISDDITEF